MRIISQDECLDIPYEQIALQRRGNEICLIRRDLCGLERSILDPVIAKYSTGEKAIKAMKMCRKEYEGLKHSEIFNHASSYFFQFPKDEEVEA